MPAGTGGTGEPTLLTDAQIIALWVYEGGALNTAGVALARAKSESGGDFSVTSSNPDGGTNVGLYQLDTKGVGSGYSIQQLSDPYTNTKITVAATNGGTDWREWADNWDQFIAEADAALSSFRIAAGQNLGNYAKSVLKGLAGGSGAGAPPSPSTAEDQGGGGGWLSFLTDPLSAASDMLKIVEFLINPLSWLRILAGFAGFLFLGAGLYMMAKAA
jgi:Lysozyme like domain